MKYADYTWHVVFMCGPTDCWPHAAFLNKQEAVEWGIAHQVGDGYLIKEMSLAELAELTDD